MIPTISGSSMIGLDGSESHAARLARPIANARVGQEARKMRSIAKSAARRPHHDDTTSGVTAVELRGDL